MASDPWNGLPENPEQSRWYWVNGGPMLWDASKQKWKHDDGEDIYHSTPSAASQQNWSYRGPLREYPDLAARVEAERVAVRRKIAAMLPEIIRRGNVATFAMQDAILNMNLDLAPTSAYDAAIKAAEIGTLRAVLCVLATGSEASKRVQALLDNAIRAAAGGWGMSACPGCGGIVGRDCYNPVECQQIVRDMQMNEWERQAAEVALTPAEAAALARIREGWAVVPREPSPDLWPTYCAENQAQPGSAWDTLSQKLYRAIIKHYGSTEKPNDR